MLYCGKATEAEIQKNGLSGVRIVPIPQAGSSTLSTASVDTGPSLKNFFPEAEPARIRARLDADSDIVATLVENSLSASSRQNVDDVLYHVSNLTPAEKLLLYLKLPTGNEQHDPLKQPTNPLGSRREISLTISWIKTHYKEDQKISIPKQDVYTQYMEYCSTNQIKPLSTADFGKVMKQVYPNVRPRRLGTRGNSRYCYSGMAFRDNLPKPKVPELPGFDGKTVCKWASKILGTEEFASIASLELHLLENNLVADFEKCSLTTFDNSNIFENENSYIMSSKICRPTGKKNGASGKKKNEGDVTTPPARYKNKKPGGKRATPKKSTSLDEFVKKVRLSEDDTTMTPTPTVAESPSVTSSSSTSSTTTSSAKLPIPRLPKITLRANKQNETVEVKRQKPLVPKSCTNFTLVASSNTELLENGNSLEQEEELLTYFRRHSEDETKGSQLRMLLERSKDQDRGSKRRVSFETLSASATPLPTPAVTPNSTCCTSNSMTTTPVLATHTSASNTGVSVGLSSVPESPGGVAARKTFSFVPISPISPDSPFLQPNNLTIASPSQLRCTSVNEPVMVKQKREAPLLQSLLQSSPANSCRSQSVPTDSLPQITPVPSETTDFDITDTDSSNLLMIEDSSESLLIDSSINQDNLNQILNIIDEMETGKDPLSKSYPSSPTSGYGSGGGLSSQVSGDSSVVSDFLTPPDHRLARSYPCTPSIDTATTSSSSLTDPGRSTTLPVLEGNINLFDDPLGLDCDDAFGSLVTSQLTSDPL